ncbi:MAG TPA: hypothetical protein VHN55_05000, partial [Sphingomicrobium sp.]|nr:hypothetical protein [Sphingomicrobium sp.]
PPPPPPASGPPISFRDEVIPWLDDGVGTDDQEDEEDEVIDVSGLFGDSDLIDAGVTSGADPTAWDPIGIDRRPDSPGNSGGGKPD